MTDPVKQRVHTDNWIAIKAKTPTKNYIIITAVVVSVIGLLVASGILLHLNVNTITIFLGSSSLAAAATFYLFGKSKNPNYQIKITTLYTQSIEDYLGSPCSLTSEQVSTKIQERETELKKTFDHIQSDIICFQNALQFTPEALAKIFPSYDYFSFGTESCLVAWKLSRFEHLQYAELKHEDSLLVLLQDKANKTMICMASDMSEEVAVNLNTMNTCKSADLYVYARRLTAEQTEILKDGGYTTIDGTVSTDYIYARGDKIKMTLNELSPLTITICFQPQRLM